MMERVNGAYDVLGNPEERRQYDAEIAAGFQRSNEPSAHGSYGRPAYSQPTAGARPQSAWNPQWGTTSDDPRERQAEAEARWEAMHAQDHATQGPFGDVWANVPDQQVQGGLSGWAVGGTRYLADRPDHFWNPVHRAAATEYLCQRPG